MARSARKRVRERDAVRSVVQPDAAAAAARPGTESTATTGQSGNRVMSDIKNPAEADRNVDQIRDILFGGQMRDYERRFVELDQRLATDMARLQEAQNEQLKRLERRLDEQFEKLTQQLRKEVQDRTSAVDDLESRVQQAARTARSEINAGIDALQHELAATDERLRAALTELEAALARRAGELDASLARSSGDLRAEKVGREDLAALMTEVALRLKGHFDLPGAK